MFNFANSIYARKFPCENYIAKIDRKTYNLYESYPVFEFNGKILLTDRNNFSKSNKKFWLFDIVEKKLDRIVTYEEAHAMRERYQKIQRKHWLENADADYLRDRVEQARQELERAQAKYEQALADYESRQA